MRQEQPSFGIIDDLFEPLDWLVAAPSSSRELLEADLHRQQLELLPVNAAHSTQVHGRQADGA